MKSAREMVWQTSNMEYGRFYDLTTEDEQESLVGDRGGRCEVLTKTLIECQKQLGIMRLRDSSPDSEFSDEFDPPTASYFEAHLQRMKKVNQSTSSRVKKSTYSEMYPEEAAVKNSQTTSHSTSVPPPSTDQSSTIRMAPSILEKSASSVDPIDENTRSQNGHFGRVDPTGIEEDTKQLELVLTRLAEKLQPLTTGGLPVLKFTSRNTKPVQQVKERRIQRASKPNKKLQRKLPKCQPKHMTECMSAGLPRLPPYCRYGFYRYYGYAGQGAKTSWGHNLPLGQRPPYGKRTKGLFKY